MANQKDLRLAPEARGSFTLIFYALGLGKNIWKVVPA
jgi:hypothetical protein